jgi:xanthine/uracil permease
MQPATAFGVQSSGMSLQNETYGIVACVLFVPCTVTLIVALSLPPERRKRLLRALATGVVALLLSFSLLRTAGELCALMIRRHWPNAWFAGLIVWYALFFAIGCSTVVAVVAGLYTMKHPRSD